MVVKSPHSSPQIISNTPETHIVPFKGLQQEITDVFVTWGMGKTLPEDESVERFPQQAACRLFPWKLGTDWRIAQPLERIMPAWKTFQKAGNLHYLDLSHPPNWDQGNFQAKGFQNSASCQWEKVFQGACHRHKPSRGECSWRVRGLQPVGKGREIPCRKSQRKVQWEERWRHWLQQSPESENENQARWPRQSGGMTASPPISNSTKQRLRPKGDTAFII